MQKYFILIFIILTSIILVHSNSLNFDQDKRTRREDGFFSKVKSGFKTTAQKTGQFFEKGYEELKNLFSSERKVGDYIAQDIDVRFAFDDEESEAEPSSTFSP